MVKEDYTFENNLIKIGQSAEENDKIVSDAKQTDIWFHLANFSSCHVIITCSNEYPITNQMINYCAMIVKQNTKYKNLSKVTVNYTEIKNVRKTNVRGMVILKGKVKNIIC